MATIELVSCSEFWSSSCRIRQKQIALQETGTFLMLLCNSICYLNVSSIVSTWKRSVQS